MNATFLQMHKLNSPFTAFAPLIMFLLLIATHLWSVVLSIQVNGFFSAWGIISAVFSLVMPLISELLWGFWAWKHSHPFFIGAVVFWVLMGIVKIAHMRGAFDED